MTTTTTNETSKHGTGETALPRAKAFSRPAGLFGDTLPDRPKLLVREDTTERDQPSFLERVSSPPTDRVGMVLSGRFKLLSVIGRGPLGTVYEAEDMELDAFVAIKVLARELCDTPAILERVRRQIAKARSVIHPNVCRIFDINRHEDRHYLVMEYVPGRTLADEIRQGMSADTARRRFLQILDALQAIHAVGLVHGSVSPIHVRVRADGVLKLTSTGLSCDLLGGTGLHPEDHDCSSPEQREGHHATVRSDVYAVGQIARDFLEHAKHPDDLPVLRQLAERSTDPDPSKRFASVLAVLEEFDHLSQAHRGALSPMPVQQLTSTALPEPEISSGDVPLATVGLVVMGISGALRRLWRVAIPLPVVALGVMVFFFVNEAKHSLTISPSSESSFFGIVSGGSADADGAAVRPLHTPTAKKTAEPRKAKTAESLTVPGWAPLTDTANLADDTDDEASAHKTENVGQEPPRPNRSPSDLGGAIDMGLRPTY